MSQCDNVLLSTAYFAPVQYYCKLISYKNIQIEIFENFPKQSYRNRCVISGANGLLTLSVPIKKSETDKILTKDVQIDYSTRWQAIHWRAIESAYRSSPFFMYYADDIEPFFRKKTQNITSLNSDIQKVILGLLGLKRDITFSNEYIKVPDNQIDYRESIHPKPRLYKPDETFNPEPYYQVFESRYGFVPNLSILDLLFNMGPSAIDVLTQSIIQK